MGDWNKRDRYLAQVAERLLEGEKSFTLRRSHLVGPSGISRGTIYNHYPQEADLILALCRHRWTRSLEQAELLANEASSPLDAFLLHQCWLLWDQRHHQRFVLQRLMPNPDVLAAGSSQHRDAYTQAHRAHNDAYRQWVSALSEDRAFDRVALVGSYIRGSLIQCDDDERCAEDPALYDQYAYGLCQLMGRSDRRGPSLAQIRDKLAQWREECEPARLRALA
ncbi:TetR/AcrR family transcriptional regulator [Ferrimonas balearica]|uniref:TetR/AcrR family transcriptional regulator n=1 Tax=Ferrimonas balearica TaxID=44012 RepID=UPI001C99A020|nr:TetR/AcrR family transcriptional regulator [Ferrimonas balearica]MBY5923037.1 TetR/AcrR family transcriptional regulator [Ferrimonas balearica]MBY5997586.1 TetR/AcrR family transcriptional regulator [Ferrimonas balearica]